MSEKILSGACSDCPMRRKINCGEAEVVMATAHTIPYAYSFGEVFYIIATPNDPIDHYSFEFSDAPEDPDAGRLEIRPLQTEAFTTKADAAAEVVAEQAKSEQLDEDVFIISDKSNIDIQIDKSMQEFSVEVLSQEAKQASLKESLVESIANCDGPEKDESAFIVRRKKCGADILGRVIPWSVMAQRNYEQKIADQHGVVWPTPEKLGKFKPIC